MSKHETELIKIRLEKVEKMRALGYEPYPTTFKTSHNCRQIINEFENLVSSQGIVKAAGRVLALRIHGKTSFADIVDSTGKIQVYTRKDLVGEDLYSLWNLVDIGDFVGVSGKVFKTKTEEITIIAQEIKILSKAIRPLPEKWHGLKDIETRYRQRYVDLIMNPEIKEVFIKRAQIVSIIRQLLDLKGFIEVETPVLQPIYGGAFARPFETQHKMLHQKMFLRISNELYLKRLIVGGLDRVYEFSKDFRNEGLDRKHNPEFTMLELYQAYADYQDMMDLVEEIFTQIAKQLYNSLEIEYQENLINFSAPWPRLRMTDLIKEYTGVNVLEESEEKIYAVAKEKGLEVEKAPHLGKVIDMLFSEFVEPHLIQPTFVIDYPRQISPLAKAHREDPRLTERFEPYMIGMEVGNAFSELNDPIDQKARFEAQLKLRAAGDEEAMEMLDEDYIRALEYGMPPTGGLGLGIDRMTMLFTNNPSIRDVILFPQMRPE